MQHEPVLNVQHDLLFVSVVPDEGVDGVNWGPSQSAQSWGTVGSRSSTQCCGRGAQAHQLWTIYYPYSNTIVKSTCTRNSQSHFVTGFAGCELTSESHGVFGKKGVDQSKQLHQSLVLPQVFMAFEREHEVLTVATCVCV